MIMGDGSPWIALLFGALFLVLSLFALQRSLGALARGTLARIGRLRGRSASRGVRYLVRELMLAGFLAIAVAFSALILLIGAVGYLGAVVALRQIRVEAEPALAEAGAESAGSAGVWRITGYWRDRRH